MLTWFRPKSKQEVEEDFESKEITIIYPPALDWFLLFQRPQQLMVSFSRIKNVRSIFITTEVYRRLSRPIVKLSDDLFLVRNGYNWDHIAKGKKVLWFSNPSQHVLVDRSKYDFVVFDYLDNSADEFAVWANHVPKAIASADVVFTTAKVMYDKHKNDGKPLFILPNGADYEHFEKARYPMPVPPEFPKKDEGDIIVGFHGALASWVDYDLILHIAEKYKVVLIGNNSLYRRTVDHPNVINIPHRDYRILPRYIAQFDVAMVPFKLTEMIRGCDPIKFYEYLSAGKPVVATRMEELVRKYKDVTYFIDKNNAYEVIERAIREDCDYLRDKRQKVAQENSWDARAKKAIRIINHYLGR